MSILDYRLGRFQRTIVPRTLGLLLWSTLTSLACAQHDLASPEGLWRSVPVTGPTEFRMRLEANAANVEEGFFPTTYRIFDLDPNVLAGLSESAPTQAVARARLNAVAANQITLSMPDGTFRRFELIQSPVMSEALARKYPKIRSYRGHRLDDSLVTMRMDVSPAGLHAQVLAPEGTIIVDPTSVENRYVAFHKRFNAVRSQPFRCLVEGRSPEGMERAAASIALRSGDQLRSY